MCLTDVILLSLNKSIYSSQNLALRPDAEKLHVRFKYPPRNVLAHEVVCASELFCPGLRVCGYRGSFLVVIGGSIQVQPNRLHCIFASLDIHFSKHASTPTVKGT